jgi:hypothetical protein
MNVRTTLVRLQRDDPARFHLGSALLFAVATMLLNPIVHAAQADLIVSSDSSVSSSRRISAVLRIDLVYAAHGGGDFTGSRAIAFNNAVLLNVPKLSPGLGYSIGAGVLFTEIVPGFTLSTTATYTKTSHTSRVTYLSAITSFPDANLTVLEWDLDVMYQRYVIKPFVGVSPGLAWLDLPGARTDVDTTQQTATYGLDASVRGYAIRPKVGAMAEVFRGALVNVEFGYRFYAYKYSSIGSISPYGLVAQGVTLSAGMLFSWPN